MRMTVVVKSVSRGAKPRNTIASFQISRGAEPPVSVQDQYYMPMFNDILEKVGGSTVLLKLDLSKGYYQVAIADSSKDKTTFVSPFGKFNFTRMPFGLCNAPAIFQQLVERVLAECREYSAAYIDDIVIFSIS